MHLKIMAFGMHLMGTQGHGLLLAPRGFGKSTIGTVCFAIFLILRNPNIRILVVSSTASKAEAFLKEIKAQFENNENLKALFGPKYNRKAWKNAEIIVRDRDKIAKEGTVSAHGQSGAVVSKHYDVHLRDDLVNEDNARTKGQRQKLLDWIYMSLDPTLEPDGFSLTIGTRYHPKDYYGHLIENRKAEIKRQEVMTPDERSKEKPPLKVLVLQAIQQDGSSLWEQKFSISELKRKKLTMGTIRFNAQFQNSTDLMKGKIFKEEHFLYYERSQIDLAELKIFQGVDLAATKDDANDYFTIVTRGYDYNNNAYMLNLVKGRFSFREQLLLVCWKAGMTLEQINHMMNFKVDASMIIKLFKGQPAFAKTQHPNVAGIGIESNAYQRVLPDELTSYTTTLPILKINTSIDKETRMMRLSPRFENGKEFLPNDNSMDHFVEEALLFPDADHDDVLDATDLCNQARDHFVEPEDEYDDDVKVF